VKEEIDGLVCVPVELLRRHEGVDGLGLGQDDPQVI